MMSVSRESSFRVTLHLSYFYHDHRAVCRIFVSNKMKTVKDLKARISEIFGIDNYYLTSQNHYLPDQEDVRILECDDIIIAVPNKTPLPSHAENIPIQNETICTPKSKEMEKKKKKRKITEIIDPESEFQEPLLIKKKKKKKKEKQENIDLVGKESQIHSKEFPSKSSNIPPEGPKIHENTKLLDTINYFETLKDTPCVRQSTISKIKPLNLDPKVKDDLIGIFDSKEAKSNIISSTPNCNSEKNIKKPITQTLESKSEINGKLVNVLDQREVKSHIFYSSTPKQNQNNSSFGPPLMKIDRKINIVKNIVTNNSNNNRAISNNNLEESPINDMEIDTENVNNIINNKSVDIIDKVVINNDKNTKSIDSNISKNKNDNIKIYQHTDNITEDGKEVLSKTETVFNDKTECHESLNELQQKDSIANNQNDKSAIILISNTNSNNNTPNSTYALPSNTVSRLQKVQDAISINSDTYSETHDSLISTSHDDQSLDCVNMRSKRKRIRKRKKKTSSFVDTPDPIIPFKPLVCEANPKVHIRFDDENQETEDCSIISIKSENESLIIPTVKQSTNEKNENDDSGLNEKIILSCPTMKTLTPKTGDIITFKVLKMSESYTPEHSKYITGKVDTYDPKTGDIDFFILDGKNEFAEPQGKFSLIDDENDETEEIKNQEIVTLNWNNLVDPRLLYP